MSRPGTRARGLGERHSGMEAERARLGQAAATTMRWPTRWAVTSGPLIPAARFASALSLSRAR